MKRASDLAVQFGRTCQSPRTGFIHLFLDQPGGDTIPVYENFCFALGLIRQKTAEGVSEGKELLERLFAFQAPESTLWEGNFPVYLHDYPRSWNSLQPLRIAPLLQMLLKQFSSILNPEFKEKSAGVLALLLASIERHRERKGLTSFWERRYQALLGHSVPIEEPTSAEGWAQELITADLLGEGDLNVSRLIHPLLGYAGPGAEEAQERFEPKPTLLEWWMHPNRFYRPHPLQIELAALPDRGENPSTLWSGEAGGWRVRQSSESALSFSDAASGEEEKNLLRCSWVGTGVIHSLVIPGALGRQRIEETEKGVEIVFDLPEIFNVSQNDLIEVAAYCNVSEETELFIAGEKASIFCLGDSVEVRTSKFSLQLRFDLIGGSGAFCGQISRSNRPLQTVCRGEELYSAFDWKISLRTLRRSSDARLRLSLERTLRPQDETPPVHIEASQEGRDILRFCR